MINTTEFSLLRGIPGPIYRSEGKDMNLYYAPGYLLRVDSGSIPGVERQIFNFQDKPHEASVGALLAHSTCAQRDWEDLLHRSYEPQSLHLYLNRRCQMACRYCFSDLPDLPDPAEISVDAVLAMAELVAKNCARENLSLVTVFHGGGEPVLSWRLIDKIQPGLLRLANMYEVRLLRYIATNGVMSAQRAHWLAHSFDLVGLSIDGPSDIQAFQRPLRRTKGDGITAILRTAHILKESGIPVQVRVTLSARNAARQVEICRYLCENISPRSVSVEPVYLGGRADLSMLLKMDQLDEFVRSFFEARAEAHRHGVDWHISGARPAEIHGPYCNIFRQVLQLVPGDVISVCFKDTSTHQTNARGMKAGYFNGELHLDRERINALRATFIRPPVCERCLLGYHCTFNCPNACLLRNEKTSDILCQLLKSIFFIDLSEKADELSRMPAKIVGTVMTNI
jgi:sulfatase maturation enzyme AslB (radical SAM superfamily)